MSPKGVITNSGPILRICEKFEKLGTIFDMKLNQNNVKYMFLNSGSKKLIHYGFDALETLSMSRQRYQ